jgi:hypothetical protein
LAAVAPIALVDAQITSTRTENSPARFNDLSSSAIYADLKSRSIDPLVGAPPALRRAFVQYDSAMGGGHNLNPDAKDAAKSARALNSAIGDLKLTSNVQVHTAKPGARIWYRLIAQTGVGAFPKLSSSSDDIGIGIYLFWAERKSKATSAPVQVRAIRPRVAVDIEEKAK